MMEGPRHQHLHQEWQEPLEELVACYMGLEDPLLVKHRTHVFKDRNTTRGNLFRSVGPYGRSLSLYMGPGHARFALHDAIEDAAHQVARLVGFHAVRQPMDLIAHAIKPENRERFMGAQRPLRGPIAGDSSLTWSSFASTSRVRTAYL